MTKQSEITRRVMLGSGISVALAFSAVPAWAAYPNKPITLLVGWPAGGGMDVFARALTKYAPKYIGTKMIIRQRPGGAGAIAHDELVRAAPDGYTLAVSNIPHQAVEAETRAKGQSGFRLDQLTWLGTFARVPSAILVRSDSKMKTLADLIAVAKENPGKFTMSVPGARTASAAFVYFVNEKLGIKTTVIGYKGGSEALKALLGGEVDAMGSNATWTVRYGDKTRTLAIASEKPDPLAPKVPTFLDKGFDVVDYLTRSVSGPKGMPDAVVRHLRQGFQAMSKDPHFVADMKKIGLRVDFKTGKQTEQYVATYVKKHQATFAEMKKIENR